VKARNAHRWRSVFSVPGFMERSCFRCPWFDNSQMALDRLKRSHPFDEQYCTFPGEITNIRGYCWPDAEVGQPLTHPAVGLVHLKRMYEARLKK